jgi:hypothetical protein
VPTLRKVLAQVVSAKGFTSALLVYQGVTLLTQGPVFWNLPSRDDGSFDGVGILFWVEELPLWPFRALLIATCAASAGAAWSWWRSTDPRQGNILRILRTFVCTMGFLTLTTARASFDQLLWFDNLPALHGLGLSLAAWWMRSSAHIDLFIRWCAVVTVTTYFIAGIAKLRYGGVDWMSGDTLTNHVRFSALRLEVLGGTASPAARLMQTIPGLAIIGALISVAVELGAPLVLLSGRHVRGLWCLTVAVLHFSIAVTMFVVFPYHLVGLAVLPVLLFRSDGRPLRSG